MQSLMYYTCSLILLVYQFPKLTWYFNLVPSAAVSPPLKVYSMRFTPNSAPKFSDLVTLLPLVSGKPIQTSVKMKSTLETSSKA